jgi:hypothetical protein
LGGGRDVLSPLKRRLRIYIEKPQELTLYSYVTNNPLSYVDPTGMVYEVPGIEILRCMRRLKIRDRIMYKWLMRSAEECYERWGIPPLPAYLHHKLRGITKKWKLIYRTYCPGRFPDATKYEYCKEAVVQQFCKDR